MQWPRELLLPGDYPQQHIVRLPFDEANGLEWFLTAGNYSQVAPHLHGTPLMIDHHPASVQQHFT